MTTTAAPKRRVRKEFLLSGWCNPSCPPESHERCQGGQTANPDKEFQGCPCACHLGEEYECGCGNIIREAPIMTRLWLGPDDDPDEMVYTHVSATDGRAIGEECPR